MIFLVALFIVVPIVELYVIIKIGGLIGIWPTLALLLADAILGSLLLKQQGRSAWNRFNKALAEKRFPGKEVADGLLIAIGATLLLTPGFVTDIFGLLFLIPPSRAIVRRLLKGVVGKRLIVMGGPAGAAYGAASAGNRAYGYYSRRPGAGDPPPPNGADPWAGANGARSDYDVEGTAEEIDEDDPRLGR